VVYIVGYLTVQVSAGDSDAAIVRFVNSARADLRETGLEKAVARFDPTPAAYYEASDILGLLYHNKLLHDRLAAYPAFLALGERQEFQDLATDSEFQNLLATQATVGQVVNHPKTQAILGNQEILTLLGQTDLKDLLQYLKTGESPKYSGVRILGRWQLDPYGTLLQMKRRKARISTADMRMLRQQLDFVKAYTLMVTPDSNASLKGPDVQPLIQKYMGDLSKAFASGTSRRATVQVVQQAPPQAAPSQPGMSSEMQRRYGNLRGGPSAAPAATATTTAVVPVTTTTITPAAVAAEVAKLPIVVLAQGNWSGDSPNYELKLQAQAPGFKFDGGNNSATLSAEVRDDRLYLTDNDQMIVLARY
jgi:hypothetical protein